MKNRLFLISVFFIIFQHYLYAHSIVLQTIDNEDGTMEIYGGFSTGQSAAGAKLLIKSEINSKILYENRVPQTGSLTIKVPNQPYTIILDSGPGHKIERKGDIKPKEGFDKKIMQEKQINIPFITTFSLSLIFILLAFLLSLKNRKKIKI